LKNKITGDKKLTDILRKYIYYENWIVYFWKPIPSGDFILQILPIDILISIIALLYILFHNCFFLSFFMIIYDNARKRSSMIYLLRSPNARSERWRRRELPYKEVVVARHLFI